MTQCEIDIAALKLELEELKKQVANQSNAIKEHGPWLEEHEDRIDKHDERFEQIDRQNEMWRTAIVNDNAAMQKRITDFKDEVSKKIDTMTIGVEQVVKAVSSTKAFYDDRDKLLTLVHESTKKADETMLKVLEYMKTMEGK